MIPPTCPSSGGGWGEDVSCNIQKGFVNIAYKIRVSSNGNGKEARIVHKRLRLSCLILLNVTVTE